MRRYILGLTIVVAAAASAQGFSPEEAVKRMSVMSGFEASLAAAEPIVRQPVCIEFDDRGRLWVVQYLQYPNPAGLVRTKVDRYSRTEYDRVPEPPPHGPKGADRVTILTDVDANGQARGSKDFINGLNLCSGIAFGHGGVYVLQVPYLLFYPDKNKDDVPDGDPEVLLTGFGMQDAHSVANSLTWGPDGWLYGCQGSTVTSRIRGIEFQQGVWRFHPITHKFELFCEGGGNSWGLDFDKDGNLFYSTNYGGFRLLHGVQGAYYWKSFGKHGALHNPYAYGYIDHVPQENFQGGHVTVGGIVYQSNSFPKEFQGKYLVGDLLGHASYWNDLIPVGSSFRCVNGPAFLESNDTWFATSDLTIGPDGAVYIADWYDKRTAHPDPDADWDRSNGRVYRIQAKGAKPYTPPDVTKFSSDQLVDLIGDSNEWLARKAQRVLADRRDPTVVPRLKDMVLHSSDDYLALDALWALYVSGGFDEAFASQTLHHHFGPIRWWTVRLLGDECKVSPEISKQLIELAEKDEDVKVRSQLASTAKRLPAADGLPIVEKILLRDIDAKDPHLPLLLWWAVEGHAIEARDMLVQFFSSPQAWKSGLVRDEIVGRLVQRYSADGSDESLNACAMLIHSAPTADAKRHLIASLDDGLAEQTTKHTAPLPLKSVMEKLAAENPTDARLIGAMARLGLSDARRRAASIAFDPSSAEALRVAMLGVVAEDAEPANVPQLIKLLDNHDEKVQLAALTALKPFDSSDVTSELLRRLPKFKPAVGARATDLLLSRPDSADALLETVDSGKWPAAKITQDQLRVVARFSKPKLNELVRKHWGSLSAGTPEEKLADIRRLNNDLRAFPGNPIAGKAIFEQTCAVCHHLKGFGADVGPDLTHANRKDRDFLLVSIVDPSATIRSEYLNYEIRTTDGEFLSGLIASQTPASVTLKGANNQRTTVPRAKIKEMKESAVSLMPEGLLAKMSPQQVRDLFAYLQKD